MKLSATLCMALCMLLSASYSYSQANKSMKGAYALTRQTVNDTAMPIQQMKLYTEKYMIYADPIPGDSLADYGIGPSKTQDGKVIEYVFYTSSGGAHIDTVKLDI